MRDAASQELLVPLEHVSFQKHRQNTDDEEKRFGDDYRYASGALGAESSVGLLTPASMDSNKGSFHLIRSIRSKLPWQPRWSSEGWRSGVILGSILSALTLLVNIIVASVFYSTTQRNGHGSSIAAIYTGSCDATERMSIGVHLAINILSTLLLGASNYCMQALSAPTRKDLDLAHQRGRWLDIGVQSITNLRFVATKRRIFWLCLGLSSIPLHLVYNSTFFTSTSDNYYDVYIATEGFARGSSYLEAFDHPANVTMQLESGNVVTKEMYLNASFEISLNWHYLTKPHDIQQEAKLGESGSFRRLNKRDCVEAYANELLKDRRNLIIVTAGGPACSNPEVQVVRTLNTWYPDIICNSSSLLSVTKIAVPPIADENARNWYPWICSDMGSGSCRDYYHDAMDNETWTVYGYPVSYCLSEEMQSQCKFNVALSLLLVVICFNIIKVICLSWVAATMTKEEPLFTIGDAIASFIRVPDSSTKGTCLLSKEDLKRKTLTKYIEGLPMQPDGSQHMAVYKGRKHKLHKAASGRQWVVVWSLTLIAILIIAIFLVYSLWQLDYSYNLGNAQGIGAISLGRISPYNLIRGWAVPSTGERATIGAVLIANLPQVLLSFVYILINGAFTCMALAREWNRWSHGSRKALRVSNPRGQQRSTYFLQLPYRFGVPLLVASGVLHWLVSQSVFLAQVETRDAVGNVVDDGGDATLTTCGFSPLGMILVVVVLGVLLGAVAAAGQRRLGPGIPLAGSCSLAIAAACHAPDGTSAEGPLMWGVVTVPENGDSAVRHCSFSNEEVDAPIEGETYA